MKPQELRIDNYVSHNGHPVLVTGTMANISKMIAVQYIKNDSLVYTENCNPKEIEPIPLTPEILVKAGLLGQSLYDGSFYYYFNSPISFYRADDKNGKNKQFLANIEFVHELQNLYHALTGEELEIEL